MNTNPITNKNMKRIAIAAGTTAAALFLTAGFVASRGNGSNNESDTPVLKVPAPVMEIAAAPQAAEAAIDTQTEAEATPVVEAKSDSTTTKAPSTKKAKSKQSPVLTGGLVSAGPVVEEVAATPAPETTVAPTPQVAETAVAEAPVVTLPAEQPAVDQPVVEAAPAPAPAPTGGSTSLNIPKIIGTPNLSSKLAGVDLSKLTTVTLPKPCLPGISC
jgi:FtsZ-interacting cell division protein ZipA